MDEMNPFGNYTYEGLMGSINKKWKIKCMLPIIMSVALVSCAPSVPEDMVEETIAEETIAEETIAEETVTQETIIEETITQEVLIDEMLQENVSEETVHEVVEEIEETYPVRVGLDYVEKPQKRSRWEAIKKIEELSLELPHLSFILENADLYPEVVLCSVAENPEMADYACGYLDSDGSVTGGLIQAELEQEYPLLLQFDPRWGYYPYGNTAIAHSGCGPTCLSMAIFYLTRNETVTPDVIAKYSTDNGYYVKNVGTAWSLLEDYPSIWGLSSAKLPISEENMNEKLEKGNILICSMRPGNFTTGGHFVVVYGMDEEGYKVNDPKCVYRSNRSWSYKELSAEIKGIWCIGEE